MEKFNVNRNSDLLNKEAFQSFSENGYVLLENFLSESEVENIKLKVLDLVEYENKNKKSHVYGENLQRVWNLLNKDIVFHELLLSKQVDLWMDKIFERNTTHRKYFLSSFQANILHPGAKAQILHTDTPVPEPIPPYPIKANIIWALDDFSENNGATEIIEKTHGMKMRPSRTPLPEDQQKLKKVIIKKGGVIITHGNLWHRSGDNNASKSRCVLLSSFAASYAREIACEDDSARFLSTKMRAVINPLLWDMIGGNHGVKPGNDYEL